MKKLSDQQIIEMCINYKSYYKILDIYRIIHKGRNRIWLKVECDEGHIYDVLFDNFKKAGCPTCRDIMISKYNTKFSEKQIENQCAIKKLKWINKLQIINGMKKNHNNIFVFECCVCGHILKCNITHLFSNRGCGGCLEVGNKGQDGFEKDFYFKYNANEYKVVGKYTTCKDNIEILHVPCGNIIKRTPDKLLSNQLNLCKICYPLTIGEEKVTKFLIDNNIKFSNQHYFSDLKGINNGLLRFDFAVFEDEEKTKLKYLIEYDGEFHYIITTLSNDLEKQQIHDKLKDEYCINNNINLIRIPYWDFPDIEKILFEKLNVKENYI